MSIKGWVGLVVTWLASLFCFYKFGKAIKGKEVEADEATSRADVISRANTAGSNAVARYRASKITLSCIALLLLCGCSSYTGTDNSIPCSTMKCSDYTSEDDAWINGILNEVCGFSCKA